MEVVVAIGVRMYGWIFFEWMRVFVWFFFFVFPILSVLLNMYIPYDVSKKKL